MLRSWLASIGLEKYASLFEENEIDAQTLRGLTEKDLIDLGLAFGPRRVLLNALSEQGSTALESAVVSESSSLTASTSDGERRQLTVLFCDMVGFTEIASRVDPEVLHKIIALYEDACAAAITRYGGHVFQRLGDGIVAFFGYPSAHEDEAERAIRAGLTIIEGLTRLEVPVVGRLRARAGIATGLVVTSTEKGAVGETMNLAARLQAIATEGTLVISERVRRNADTVFRYEDLGAHVLKGIERPQQVFRVHGATAADEDIGPKHQGVRGELVGREQELGLLLDRWERAGEGNGQVVVLLGEPGIGKSRLLRALDEKLAGVAHRRLSLRCSPYFTQTPLQPLVDRLPNILGWAAGDDHAVETKKLAAFLRALDIPPEEALPLLMVFLSRPAPAEHPLPVMSPERQRRRTLEILAEIPLVLSRRQPVLLAIEDLHWADPTTLDLISRHIEHAPTASFMLVVTARSGFDLPWNTKSYLSPVMLNRLTRRQGEACVLAWAAGKRLPVEVTSRLIDKADGVPLFLEELTRAVLESGALRETEQGYELVGDIAALTIPATLQDSLMARLDRLGEAKEVARIAAVIGRDFDQALIEDVSGLMPEALQLALDSLTRAELVFRRGSSPNVTYTFKHALVRDAAYESLLLSRRRAIHERIATALIENYPDRAVQRPEFVAHHFDGAGLSEQAVHWWRRAGERAAERSAPAEAAAHFRHALDVLAQQASSPERDAAELDLRSMLGMELIKRFGWGSEEVKRQFTRVHELSYLVEDLKARFTAVHLLAANLHLQGNFVAAEAMHRDGLELAKQIGDQDLIAGGHMGVGFVLHFRGMLGEAMDHLDRAAQAACVEHGARYVELFALNLTIVVPIQQAIVQCIQGYPDMALRTSVGALDAARNYPHSFTLTYSLMLQGFVHVLLDEAAPACAVLDEALDRSTDQEFMLVQTWVTGFMGIANLVSGDCQKAALLLTKAAEISEHVGALMAVPLFLVHEARANLRCGQAVEAQRALDRAFKISNDMQGYEYDTILWCVKAEIAHVLNPEDDIAAEQAYLKAIEVARSQSAKLFELEAATALAKLWKAQGQSSDALALLKPIYDWFSEGLNTKPLKAARLLIDTLC